MESAFLAKPYNLAFALPHVLDMLSKKINFGSSVTPSNFHDVSFPFVQYHIYLHLLATINKTWHLLALP